MVQRSKKTKLTFDISANLYNDTPPNAFMIHYYLGYTPRYTLVTHMETHSDPPGETPLHTPITCIPNPRVAKK